MRWTQFLKTLLTRPVRRARSLPKRVASKRLALETLEVRDVPSIGLQAGAIYGLPGLSNGSVARGDFNHDGTTDLALVSGGAVAVVLGNGDRTFADPSYYTTGVGSNAAAAGDFDNDGNLDLVVTNRGWRVLVLGSAGDGDVRPVCGGQYPRAAEVATSMATAVRMWPSSFRRTTSSACCSTTVPVASGCLPTQWAPSPKQ